MTRQSVFTAIVLMLGCSAASGGSGKNPLIGHWVPEYIPKESDGSPATCAESIDFTATHQRIVYGGLTPNTFERDVSYNVSAKYVYVIGKGNGNATRYNLVSPGHIKFNGWPDCGYKRS